jgi:hypothetical protein
VWESILWNRLYESSTQQNESVVSTAEGKVNERNVLLKYGSVALQNQSQKVPKNIEIE